MKCIRCKTEIEHLGVCPACWEEIKGKVPVEVEDDDRFEAQYLIEDHFGSIEAAELDGFFGERR